MNIQHIIITKMTKNDYMNIKDVNDVYVYEDISYKGETYESFLENCYKYNFYNKYFLYTFLPGDSLDYIFVNSKLEILDDDILFNILKKSKLNKTDNKDVYYLLQDINNLIDEKMYNKKKIII